MKRSFPKPASATATTPSRLRFLPALGVAAVAVILTGCLRVPPMRLLPDHIHSVYVPMARNDSFELDVEEDLTRYIQEAIDEDGRLRREGRRMADLAIEGVLTDYKVIPTYFEDDDFPGASELLLEAEVTAYDPFDYDRQQPLGVWEEITVIHTFPSNTRVMFQQVDVDAKQRALRELAIAIVNTVMNMPPTDLDAESPGLWTASDSRARFRSSYAVREPEPQTSQD